MRTLSDDPAEALDPGSDLHLMQELFNATAESRRVFSEVHFRDPSDPDLTVGMGHWTGQRLAALFVRLRAAPEVWAGLTGRWAAAMTPAHWAQIADETGAEGSGAATVDRALVQALCADGAEDAAVAGRLLPWAATVRERFNTPAHWFTAGWKTVARDEPVAVAQVGHWADTVLIPGQRAAADRGLATRGGVACAISAQSSGLGATMFGRNVRQARASTSGLTRTWPLDRVPDEARPAAGIAADEAALLQDWRAVAAWQFYAMRTRRVRNRMRLIWRAFFEASWGPLPATSALAAVTAVPRHRVPAMDARPFDFTVRLR